MKVAHGVERVDECAWCTQAAAPHFLSRSGLRHDDRGFLRTNLKLQCLQNDIPQRSTRPATVVRWFLTAPIRPLGVPKSQHAIDEVGWLWSVPVASSWPTARPEEFVEHVPQTRLLALVGLGGWDLCCLRQMALEARGLYARRRTGSTARWMCAVHRWLAFTR